MFDRNRKTHTESHTCSHSRTHNDTDIGFRDVTVYVYVCVCVCDVFGGSEGYNAMLVCENVLVCVCVCVCVCPCEVECSCVVTALLWLLVYVSMHTYM